MRQQTGAFLPEQNAENGNVGGEVMELSANRALM
jgi:hypothetical protein